MALLVMTTREQMNWIGRRALLRLDPMLIEVTVNDVKVSYGNVRFLVQPVAGQGEKWIEASSLKEMEHK